jgi:RNA recognition motif-containing protein
MGHNQIHNFMMGPGQTGGPLTTMPMQNFSSSSAPLDVNFESHEQAALKITGLPFEVKYEEIINFFCEYKVVPNSVHIESKEGGRRSGVGYIVFSSAEECNTAMNQLQGQFIGSRYVVLL